MTVKLLKSTIVFISLTKRINSNGDSGSQIQIQYIIDYTETLEIDGVILFLGFKKKPSTLSNGIS